jgi:hypothetical protein
LDHTGVTVFRFQFGEVYIEDAHPHSQRAAPAFATWPCPGCDQRRLLDDAWMLSVSDAPERSGLRHVLVCASCSSNAGVARLFKQQEPTA